MLLHLIQHSLSWFMDLVHSFGYQHIILDGFTLVRIVFIHTFNGASLHDCLWILGKAYLRLHISCYLGHVPFSLD